MGTVVFPLLFLLVFVISPTLAPFIGLLFLNVWIWWKAEISQFLSRNVLHEYFDLIEMKEKMEVPHVLTFLLSHRNKVEENSVDFFSLFGIIAMVALSIFTGSSDESLFWITVAGAVPAISWVVLLRANATLHRKIVFQKEEGEKFRMEMMRKIILDKIKEIEENSNSNSKK